MKPTDQRQRRGYTLFEMVLVIASATIILSSCAMLLHGLLQLDRAGRAHQNDASTVSRLAKQFRQDVRTAAKAERGDSGTPRSPRLTLTTSSAPTVCYQVEGDRLIRSETLGDEPVRRESYSIARLGPVAFEEDGPFVRLVLLRKPNEPGAVLRPGARIDARLGKHAALIQASEPKS